MPQHLKSLVATALTFYLSAAPSMVCIASAAETAKPLQKSHQTASAPKVHMDTTAGAQPASIKAEPTEPQASAPPKKMGFRYLEGKIVKDADSPLLEGVVQELPAKVDLNLTLNCYLNSEVSVKGDEVRARISVDVKDKGKVLVPEGWYVRGLVTKAVSPKRGGRDGYVDVEFDKLVSPDGAIELPFPAKFSTKDKALKTILKVVAIDSGYVAKGALGGSLLSLQLGGLGTAISTYGISIGAGAAVGGSIGLFGALKRKGKIANSSPTEVIKLTTAEPIILPGFDPTKLPSAKKLEPLKGFVINIKKFSFEANPLGDKSTQLMRVDLVAVNETNKEFSFGDFAATNELNQIYDLDIGSNFKVLRTKIAPHSQTRGVVTYNVDKGKHEYHLILVDKNRRELSRAFIK